MKPKIAVFGAGEVGQIITSDLTLAGYKVNLLELPKYRQRIASIQELRGIHLGGETHALVSGTTGFAEPNMITTDPEEALNDIDVIFVDLPVTDYETQFEEIAPYLKDGQIVNFNTYGYWPCLRVARILRQVDRARVLLSESPAPVYWARQSREGYVESVLLRQKVPVAIFPSKKSKEAFAVLKSIFPTLEMAKNVLQTNFENINMMVHPAISLLNLGSFDRAEEKNQKFNFYVTGNTVHTGILAEAQEKERMMVCQAYGVPYTYLGERLVQYYGSEGHTIYEAIRNCKPYQGLVKGFSGWIIGFNDLRDTVSLQDVPLSLVPLVSLAGLADISTPVTKALIEIFGVIFGTDYWKTGLTLDKLGLGDSNALEVIEYVTEGKVGCTSSGQIDW